MITTTGVTICFVLLIIVVFGGMLADCKWGTRYKGITFVELLKGCGIIILGLACTLGFLILASYLGEFIN